MPANVAKKRMACRHTNVWFVGVAFRGLDKAVPRARLVCGFGLGGIGRRPIPPRNSIVAIHMRFGITGQLDPQASIRRVAVDRGRQRLPHYEIGGD